VNALATALRVPATRIGAMVKGERGVTTDTAMRLARYFGTTAELWLTLQTNFDLSKAGLKAGARSSGTFSRGPHDGHRHSSGGTGRGRRSDVRATKVNKPSVTLIGSLPPQRRAQLSIFTVSEVRPILTISP
jgi:addiction module HigA family antidote